MTSPTVLVGRPASEARRAVRMRTVALVSSHSPLIMVKACQKERRQAPASRERRRRPPASALRRRWKQGASTTWRE